MRVKSPRTYLSPRRLRSKNKSPRRLRSKSPRRLRSKNKSPRRLRSKSPIRKSVKKFVTKGWAKQSPKKISKRIKIKKACGDSCFLRPKNLGYPVCVDDSCIKDCKGIRSAYIRARQYHDDKIANKAVKLMNLYDC